MTCHALLNTKMYKEIPTYAVYIEVQCDLNEVEN